MRGMTATLTPRTQHVAVCGICDSATVCDAAAIPRAVGVDSYTGRIAVDLTATLLLPEGWEWRDIGEEVYFVCDRCRDQAA